MKRLAITKLLDSLLHGINRRARTRLGHITDPASNKSLCSLGIRFAKFAHPACDFRKQISGLKL